MKCPIFYLFLAIPALMFGIAFDASFAGGLISIIDVRPAKLFKHDVELRAYFEPQRELFDVRGPTKFSVVKLSGKSLSGESRPLAAALNWYEINGHAKDCKRVVAVEDSEGGKREIALGRPVFLLTPAQVITTGRPDEVPESLSNFIAYRISNSSSDALKRSSTADVPIEDEAKPIYLCVPAAEWHHDEHFVIKDPKRAFLIFEKKPKIRLSETTSTIDQFGLHELTKEDRQLAGVVLRLVTDGAVAPDNR